MSGRMHNPHYLLYHPGNAWRPVNKGSYARDTRRVIALNRRVGRERLMIWNAAVMAERIGALR